MHRAPQSAFSLVELSIVLVILGLLTGGILAGQSLIRASELRSISTEVQNYQSAALTFRDKYFGLPGDITNADKFWPTATNGNGDGVIGSEAPYPYGGAEAGYGLGYGLTAEHYKTWDHLAKAGLVAGSFTGVSGPGNPVQDADVGINVPAARLSGAEWCFGPARYEWRVTRDWSNSITIGHTTTDIDYCSKPVVTGAEAWNIDTKMDDGMPAVGKVAAMTSPYCTNAWTDIVMYNAVYTLNSSNKDCNMNFKLF